MLSFASLVGYLYFDSSPNRIPIIKHVVSLTFFLTSLRHNITEIYAGCNRSRLATC